MNNTIKQNMKSMKSLVEKTFDDLDKRQKTLQINAVYGAMNGAISVLEDCKSIEYAKFILPHFRDVIIEKMKEELK